MCSSHMTLKSVSESSVYWGFGDPVRTCRTCGTLQVPQNYEAGDLIILMLIFRAALMEGTGPEGVWEVSCLASGPTASSIDWVGFCNNNLLNILYVSFLHLAVSRLITKRNDSKVQDNAWQKYVWRSLRHLRYIVIYIALGIRGSARNREGQGFTSQGIY